jgi:hypothetical protein
MAAFSITRGETWLACCCAPKRMTPWLRISATTRSISRVMGSEEPRGAQRFSSSSTIT